MHIYYFVLIVTRIDLLGPLIIYGDPAVYAYYYRLICKVAGICGLPKHRAEPWIRPHSESFVGLEKLMASRTTNPQHCLAHNSYYKAIVSRTVRRLLKTEVVSPIACPLLSSVV